MNTDDADKSGSDRSRLVFAPSVTFVIRFDCTSPQHLLRCKFEADLHLGESIRNSLTRMYLICLAAMGI